MVNLTTNQRIEILLEQDLGASGLKYPDISPDGRSIVINTLGPTGGWGERGLVLIETATPYDFSSYTVRTLVPHNFRGQGDDPTDGEFSPDGQWIYFGNYSNDQNGALYKVLTVGGEPLEIYSGGEPIQRAFHPSISPDGRTLVYNSELYRDNAPGHDQEELLMVDVLAGTGGFVTRLRPGNQGGRFAKNGDGESMVIYEPGSTGTQSLFLMRRGNYISVFEPAAGATVRSMDWWQGP